MRKKMLLCTLLLLAGVSLAQAATAVIYDLEDTTVTYYYSLTPYVTFHGNTSGMDTMVFWKFDISELLPPPGGSIEILSAHLRIHGESSYGNNLPTDTVYQVPDNSWVAGYFYTYNAPAFGPVLGTYNYPGGFVGVNIDCKDYLQSTLNSGSSLISFGSQAPNNYVDETNPNYFRMIAKTYTMYGIGYTPKLEVSYVMTLPQAPAPVIEPHGDSEGYSSPIEVTITDGDPNAVIRYTTDGLDPTETSQVYTGPFMVSNTCAVKAKAWVTGMAESKATKATYQFIPVGTKVVSIASEDTSITPVYNQNLHVAFLGNWCAQDVKAYVKFSIPELAKPTNGRTIINSAIFKWVCGDMGQEPGNNPPPATLYTVSDNSWTETSPTTFWDTAPAFGQALEVFEFRGYFISHWFDVKNYIQECVDNGSTTFSFGAQAPNIYVDESHTNSFRMFSKEITQYYPSYEPKLIVDYTIDAPRVAKPKITPEGGAFVTYPTVTITSDTAGADIRYTTDGSEPTASSTQYTAPFAISAPQTIRVVAFPPSGSSLYKSEETAARFDAVPTTFNNPVEIKPATSAITCDGNLTEWADAQWVEMTEPYDGNPTDITKAYYAAKWAPDGSKIYVAVKVQDSTHVFTDTYDNWNTRDAVEIYLRTNGYSDDYKFPLQEPAQQYTIGIMLTDRDAVWTAIGGGIAVPDVCQFQAGGKEDGDWLYYEVAMTPFKYMGALAGRSSVITPVIAGQVINLDVAVAGNNGMYTGMKAENMLQWKSEEYTKFGLHKLVTQYPGDANGDKVVNVVDLGILATNYGLSGKTWADGDFNGDGLVNVVDLGILATHYGETSGSAAADSSKVISSTEAKEDTTATSTLACPAAGLPLIAGLLLAALAMMVKLEE